MSNATEWRTDLANMPRTGKTFLAILDKRVVPVLLSYGKFRMSGSEYRFCRDHPPYKVEFEDQIFEIVDEKRILKWAEISY